MAASSWLRVAVVQFAPKLGEVHANIAKARELCRGLAPRSVDLVCFPEMIFSGYAFPDAPSIAPYLEHPQTGPTSTFCAQLARHLECYVVAGFPERLSDTALNSSATTTTTTSEPESDGAPPTRRPTGANAALLFDSTGRPLHTYHKSNLFPTDLPWARPGPGFTAVDLPRPMGRTALAICNDLNVDVHSEGAWRSLETGPYELAGYVLREDVRVLVLLNAWLRPAPEEDGSRSRAAARDDNDDDDAHGAGSDSEEDGGGGNGGGDGDGLEPNWRVLNYWAMRLRPLWAKDVHMEEGVQPSETSASAREPQDVIVLICNRFGRERGHVFAGSSAMFAMRRGSGKPRLLHTMGEREEGVRVWAARIGSHTLS